VLQQQPVPAVGIGPYGAKGGVDMQAEPYPAPERLRQGCNIRVSQGRAGKGRTWLLRQSMCFLPVQFHLQSPQSGLSMTQKIRKQHQQMQFSNLRIKLPG